MTYDIAPTWEEVGFDEGIEDFPSRCDVPYRSNPLDKDVLFVFRPEGVQSRIRYSIHTGEYEEIPFDMERRIMYDLDLPEKKTMSVEQINEDTYGMDFICAQVIGTALVYRQFEIRIKCRKRTDYSHECLHLPITESRRYVFAGDEFMLETRDKERRSIEYGDTGKEDILDIYESADYLQKKELYEAFTNKVRVAHKEEIIRILKNSLKGRFFLRFRAFIETFRDVTRKAVESEVVPERIRHELSCRAHAPGTAIKIAKDLCVVVMENKYEHIDLTYQKRAYFDSERGYFFRQSAITKEWSRDTSLENYLKHSYYSQYPWDRTEFYHSQRDMGIFKNTCMEKYLKYAVIDSYRNKDKVDYILLLVQHLYLAAEQAAKMESSTFAAVTGNICSGHITDRTAPRTGIFGVSGHQLKFLEGIKIPYDISNFGDLMNDEDMVRTFPDVKKRIYAVCFYLGGYWRFENGGHVTKEEVIEASGTLYSLEKLDKEKREETERLYRDYIIMRRKYLKYKNEVTDSALHAEIMAFGEAPMNLKPSRIKDMHDKLAKVVDTIGCTERIKNYTEKISEIKRKDAKEVEYYGKEYAIILPEDAMDIIREGRILCHCVGHAGYIESMAAGGCRILFLRKISEIKKPLITIEERSSSIVQCYGAHDSINKSPAIRNFIEEYASIRNIRVEARIYQKN